MLEALDIQVNIDGKFAVDAATLRAPIGEVTALIGPSGCGKTTLLRVMAGLERPDAGSVLWKGARLDDLPPHQRPIGLMFQDFALFPHRSVAANVGFGLRMQGCAPDQIARRVAELLDLVGLPGFNDRNVAGLSGGEQQRVALARALAPEPQVLMLDEPLGSLDVVLRNRLLGEMQSIFATLGLTVIYVTHDTEEAFTVADHLALMNEGRIVRSGLPAEVWSEPGTEFAARFLGFADVFAATINRGRAELGWASVPVGRSGNMVVLRPGAVSIAADGPIPGIIETATYRGGWYDLTVVVQPGARVHVGSKEGGAPQSPVRLSIDPNEVAVVD